ncbi:cytidylyltransferase domain-containing protein [Actinocatenispora comari]|uniref:Flagellin modification protein FlmC n=1 Tax=Actinocatenispora comari TaxID=2807577 RepID=A0A8J4A9S6_9ACTN|nr:NTP transferase domain-containing protein [Actinocatenispora comari]GIL25187.1 flagellin modification protein FlmC [Actinocatenispora comari]
MTRILGIVQARMGSTRLPGKVLRPLAGRSVLGWVVRAARAAGTLDELVVATTTEPADDAVVAEASALGVATSRGSVHDVLSRFVAALDDRPADAVVRFTADCPLLDPGVVAAAANAWRAAPWLDYVSTALPRRLPRGTDVEVIAAGALRELSATAVGHHRTHVTSGLYSEPAGWSMLGLTLHPDASDLRVTLDTPDDWRLIETVVDHFGDRPVALPELVGWLRAHPAVTGLNAHVRQKVLEAG